MTTPMLHPLPTDAVFLPAGVTGLPVGAERSVQRCAACGQLLSPHDAAPDCPSCGGLLEIIHRAPVDEFNAPLSADALKHRFSQHCCALLRACGCVGVLHCAARGVSTTCRAMRAGLTGASGPAGRKGGQKKSGPSTGRFKTRAQPARSFFRGLNPGHSTGAK